MSEALERAQVLELNARRALWSMLTFWTLIPLLAVAGAIVVLTVWAIAKVT